jgi:hypothetical protein
LSFYFSTQKGMELLELVNASSSPNADDSLKLFNQWFKAINTIFKSGANLHHYAQLFASLSALRLNCPKVRAGMRPTPFSAITRHREPML